MTACDIKNIEFPEWYDDLAEFEHSSKGYLNDVVVTLLTGKQYSLNFSDPSRLAQDIEDNLSEGSRYFTQKNLVVIDTVSRRNILRVINSLAQDGLLQKVFLPEVYDESLSRESGSTGLY